MILHLAFTFVPLLFTLPVQRRGRKMLDMSKIATQGVGAAQDLHDFLGADKFACVLADPPWRFQNRMGKVAGMHHE
jgi:hypothetical protein